MDNKRINELEDRSIEISEIKCREKKNEEEGKGREGEGGNTEHLREL